MRARIVLLLVAGLLAQPSAPTVFAERAAPAAAQAAAQPAAAEPSGASAAARAAAPGAAQQDARPAAGLRGSGIPPGTARAALQQVLQRPEFARSAGALWRDAIGRWIQERMNRLADRLGGSAPILAMAGRLLAWGAALGALIALGVWLFRLRLPARRDAAWRLEPPVRRLTSREWAARARDALAAGDPREAIRCGYHAALFRLEEQQVWRVDGARTPREYLSLLQATDERRPVLADLTREFERSWYGSRAANAADLLAQLEVLGCVASSDPTT